MIQGNFARTPSRIMTLMVGAILGCGTAAADEIDQALKPILSLEREGEGNREAAEAWKQLTAAGPDALIPTLRAMETANPIAANWLLTAVNTIAGDANAQSLPLKELQAFVKDTGHSPEARRIAFEVLVEKVPSARDQLLPTMINDPSLELRREAIAEKISTAQGKELIKLFEAARDKDQVEAIAKKLEAEGVEVNLTEHFNYITQWNLLGPFDSTGGVGFDRAYAPEKSVDLSASYKGKDGANLKWKSHTTEDTYGEVDLNKALGKHQGACAYAFAAIESPTERPVHVRVTSNNAVKIFFNGKEVFAREEYHHGTRMDQYIGEGTLKKGRNEILLKVCQNEQSESWAQSWSFQLRVCDPIGSKIPVEVVSK